MVTNPAPLPPLALIAGPTASGKSALAVALAKELARVGRTAEIVNADASQVYRDIPIITAQPTASERGEIPHHLFGDTDASIAGSAADWAARARTTIAAIHARGAVPILVGGTGLYLRSLLDGIAPIPEIHARVRAEVRALHREDALAALRDADPAAAARLSPNDTARIARALEVVRSSGRPLAAWQAERCGGIGDDVRTHALILTPPRAWLVPRIHSRLVTMAASGAVDEARMLVERELDPSLPAMRAIGVREFAGVATGLSSIADAIAATALATRRYVKRQDTWLRHQMPAEWPLLSDLATAAPAAADLAGRLVDSAPPAP